MNERPNEHAVQFPVPWAGQPNSEFVGPPAREIHQHSHYPQEIEDVLDDLEGMVRAWERMARGGDPDVNCYACASVGRDAARLIRVLYRKLSEANGG